MFTSTLASQPLSEYKVKNQIYVLLWLFPCTYYGFAFLILHHENNTILHHGFSQKFKMRIILFISENLFSSWY